MTVRGFSLTLLLSAVLQWTAALSYGQARPTGIMYARGASPALSATTTTPTQAPMVYHGGPLLPNSTTYAFWWGNQADFPSDAKTGLEQFLAGLNGSSYLSIADQYMLGAHATPRFGGSFYDNSALPSLTGNNPRAKTYNEIALDVANHLYKFLTANGVTPDPTGIYFIFTSNFPPNNSSLCALHDALVFTTTGSVIFQFAWVPNSTSNLDCRPDSVAPFLIPNNYSDGTHAIVNISAHEFMETITDPLFTGWYEGYSTEIGDACAYVFQNWVQLTNSSRWKIQEEWSNQASGCVQGDGSPVQLLGAASNSSTVTTFNIPGATYGIFGNGINGGGTIAGTYYDANFYRPLAAFLRDPLGNITTFNVPGATVTVADGINSNGTIAGSYDDASGGHGFLRDPLGNFTTIDAGTSALSNNTAAYGINAAGATMGVYEEASVGRHGFVRDPVGNITTFDAPGMPYQTIPFSINDNGAIAAFTRTSTSRPMGLCAIRKAISPLSMFQPG